MTTAEFEDATLLSLVRIRTMSQDTYRSASRAALDAMAAGHHASYRGEACTGPAQPQGRIVCSSEDDDGVRSILERSRGSSEAAPYCSRVRSPPRGS